MELLQNQVLSGGMLLMVIGGGLAYLRHLPGQAWSLIERLFVLKIEVLDEDESFQWMQVWLDDRLKDALSVSVVTRRQDNPDAVDNRPRVYLVPAVGTYFFWYKRRLVTLTHTRAESSTSLIGKGNPRPRESFLIHVYSRNKALASQLLEDCRHKALPDDGKIDIRVVTYSCWSLGTRIHPRPLESVIFDDGTAERVRDDIRDFLARRQWYLHVGVPWRRGYLFHGTPGSGKTSFIKALAGEFGMNLHLLALADPEMNDNRINDLLSKVGERNILLIEDVDCAFTDRKPGPNGVLTFSGLLNAIDGVASPEGRIMFMTTNHIDRLDPALIRPGRIDVRVAFDNASQRQAEKLYLRFFPERGHLAPAFAQKVPDRTLSMASLQNYLVLHADNPTGAVNNISQLERI